MSAVIAPASICTIFISINPKLNTMKPTSHILAITLIGLTVTSRVLPAADPDIGIQIVEDVSGPELQKHGINPADFEDMQIIADVLFSTRRSAAIGYDVVDDDGQDNSLLNFLITPFEQPIPDRPVFKGMTVRDKMLAVKKFDADSTKFRKENEEWRTRVIEGAKSWLDECVEHRIKVEEDFLTRLKANRNRDFRRSDIIGSVQKANEQLAAVKTRFLILNSDLDHKPGSKSRDQKARAMTIADLAADITLIVVNTSKEPDKSILLRGLPNKVLHADSLKQAAEVIATQLGSEMPAITAKNPE
jgi:hypothetical protein